MKVFLRRWTNRDGTARAVWCLDMRDPDTGKARRYTLKGAATEREAERAAAVLIADRERRALARSLGLDPGPTLAEKALTWADLFAARLRRVGIADTTRRLEEEKVARLQTFLGENRSPATLTAATLEAYKARRLGDGCKPATINRELTILAATLRRAVEDGLLSRMPCPVRKLPDTTPPRRRFLTRAEVGAILAAVAGRPVVAEPLAFLANSGLRPCELWRMTWRDVDLEAATLAVLTTKAGRAATLRRDVLPLNQAALEVLRARRARVVERTRRGAPEPDALVFGIRPDRRRPCRNGRKKSTLPGVSGGVVCLAPSRLNAQLKAAARRAGVERPHELSLYCLRHSFASAALEAGASVREVQDLLRHRTPTLTLSTYCHSTGERLRSAVASIAVSAPQEASDHEQHPRPAACDSLPPPEGRSESERAVGEHITAARDGLVEMLAALGKEDPRP